MLNNVAITDTLIEIIFILCLYVFRAYSSNISKIFRIWTVISNFNEYV